jgi:hypothetical protein
MPTDFSKKTLTKCEKSENLLNLVTYFENNFLPLTPSLSPEGRGLR